MLENASPLKQTSLGSALAGLQCSARKPQPCAAHDDRILDADLARRRVSILVIFLIMNHSANNEVINVVTK